MESIEFFDKKLANQRAGSLSRAILGRRGSLECQFVYDFELSG
jgi:hypothetical protein